MLLLFRIKIERTVRGSKTFPGRLCRSLSEMSREVRVDEGLKVSGERVWMWLREKEMLGKPLGISRPSVLERGGGWISTGRKGGGMR